MREGRLHHGFGRISGHVAHDNPPALRSLEVDVVDSGRSLAYQLQPGSGGPEPVVHFHLVDYQHLAVSYPLQGLVVRAYRPGDILAESLYLVHRGVSQRGRVEKNYFHIHKNFGYGCKDIKKARG